MARRSPHPFDVLVERFASCSPIASLLRCREARRETVLLASRGGRRGLKRDMSCRYQAAKNRSKGPRFRFFCEEHLKLPKKEQDTALAKWAEKNA